MDSVHVTTVVAGTFYEPEIQAMTFDAEQPFKIESVKDSWSW